MAIDVQQPNLAGLAAIAGKSAPLNIAPTGALGLQALQQRQAQEASLRADALAKAQMMQQGQLAMGSQGIQQQAMDLQAQQQARQGLLDQGNLDMRQQEFTQKGAQDAAQNAYSQQQLAQQGAIGQGAVDVDKMKLVLDQQKQMAELIKGNKKQEVQEKGAFASYALMAMKGAKTPEEAQQIRTEILREGLDKGFYDKDQVKQAASLPLSQFTALAQSELIKYGVAKEYHDTQDAAKGPQAGSHIEFNPDGTLASISVDPTLAAKTKAQETVNDRSQALEKLGEMKRDFDPKWFSRLNQSQIWLSKQAELNKGIPGLEGATEAAASYLTGKDKEKRAEDIGKATSYMNAVEQFFNQSYKQPMTGAAVGKEELKGLRAGYLSGDMSPSEYVGALEQLIHKYTGESEFNKNFLKKGSDVTSSENEGLRQYFKQNGKTNAEIDAYFKGAK